MADPNSGQPLSQTSPSFSVSSGPPERRDAPRNYVFVDEKNRHRRLKVVRACEGCRKRKIKCDAANTNTWPCSACVRMKINCTPPALGFDRDDTFEYESDSFQASSFKSTSGRDPSSVRDSPEAVSQQQMFFEGSSPPSQGGRLDAQSRSDIQNTQAFTSLRFGTDDSFGGVSSQYGASSATQMAALSRSLSADPDWRSESTDSELTEALGDLKISDVAVAQYMVNHQGLADSPAVQEEEVSLPGQIGLGLVSIPDEMMPSEQIALQHFRYFFDNVHPYVPVLSPAYFYRQWHQGKDSISPLILEGIFACSTHLMDHRFESSQWLALASKHEESFKDVPRLSTLQGLLLLLKAREAVPKRGYYYRSWMSVVNMVAMAKDLELDTHNELHEAGRPCSSSDQECLVKTRVWHALYVVELMIGGPQGRTNYSVRTETIDFDGLGPSPAIDDQEQRVDEQFTHFMSACRNVRETSRIYVNLRNKKTDWAQDPEFVNQDSAYDLWLKNLPKYLEVPFPPGGVAPWISSHFVGNIHSYHRLAILMHYRPQLQQSTPGSFDGSWKRHMLTCYQAAKDMCRLQEAILQQFGLIGFLCMQRGMSFHIYSILTCIMLHLVAVTSPDNSISEGAAEYFARHMRVLEQCTSSWPIKEIQAQIESLRQAFSANVNKPFELRPNFPGSPPRSDRSSPPFSENNFNNQAFLSQPGEELPLSYAPLTPPQSTEPVPAVAVSYQTSDPLPMTTIGGDGYGGDSSTMQSVMPQTYWNPSRIFDQWNTAFGMPPPSISAQPTHNAHTSAASAANLTSQIQPTSNPMHNYNQNVETFPDYVASLPHPSQQQHQQQQQQQQQQAWTSPPAQPYVTPSMWQQAVASTYGEGLKRRWNDLPASRDIKRAR